jgi:phosphoribosylformimino-5-aminoimidazole carboxamide ribotide isomerase
MERGFRFVPTNDADRFESHAGPLNGHGEPGGGWVMNFKHNLLVLAMASAGIGFCCEAYAAGPRQGLQTAHDGNAPAQTSTGEGATTPAAQEDDKPAEKRSNDEKLIQTLSTITVTGFSRSVETSIDYQRFSDKIENVVTAADIGGLPDQSIADALTRLPGVAAQRIGGEASQINIRGLTGNFIQTTLNGRAQPSTSGSNYIQFDDYPSELIHQVAVYKSSQANVIEGGVGGTIAMETANPLDNRKDHTFNVDMRGSYNSRANEVYGANPRAFRISAAYQGKFFDDTFGIGLGFADLYQPHVAEQFVNESYSNTPQVLDGKSTYINTGVQINQVGGTGRSKGYMGTAVWQPNDSFKLTGTAFYSKFHNGSFQRGLRAQLFTNGGAVIANPVIAPNGTLIGGTASSIPGGFFGIPGLQAFSVQTTDNDQSNDASVFSGGLNAEWKNGPWTVTADVSASRARSYSVGSDVSADPYNGLGTGFPLIADQSVDFALHGLDVGDFSVANPDMYTDLGRMALSSYGIYPTTYHDRMKAFRTSVKYDLLDNPVFSAFEGGIYLNNQDYRADRSVWLYGSAWGQYWLSTPDQPPLELDASNAVRTCWKGSQFGSFPCFLALDGAAILAAHGIAPDPQKDWSQNWTETQSGDVNVKIRDAFFQADIDTTLFDKSLTGNVGLRVVHTSQYSPGLQQVGNGAGEPIADGRGVISTDYIRVNPGQSYTDYLPSLNLNLHLDYDNQVRFAAAKVMARPPINMLKSGVASFIFNGTYNLASGTNPMLDPMYATQFDLTFEHYFPDSSGAFVADLFYKHVDSFVQTITDMNYDFAAHGYQVPINPQTGQPYLNGEFQTAYNNTEGGYVRGIELQFMKTRFLPGIWSGLGVSFNYAYTQSGTKIESDLGGFPQQQALPGLSRNVASAALFFDHGKFSTRLAANYRSPFVSAAQVAFNFQTVYFASETVVDYQAAWNFNKHLSGLFQVLNLTDQPTRTYFGNPTQTSTIQYFGRTFYAGLGLKF